VKVTIIGGAGTLGSCAAFNIAVHKLADEILLVDPWENMLKAHWMDLTTAAAGQDISVHRGPFEDMTGSDVIVITSGAPAGMTSSRSELITGNLPIIKDNAEKIREFCPEAIVITETNPVDSLNYAVYLVNRNADRRKFIGYTLNDTIRFRMWAAEALAVKPSRVQGFVIGEHGHSQVMLFSSLQLDGKTVNLDETSKKRIQSLPPQILHDYETLQPKRTAGWTSAVGTAAIINAIKNNTQEIFPCSAVLEGEYGIHDLSMTVPAVIGREGIHDIKILELTEDEQKALENSVRALSPLMRHVEAYLDIQ
jgi:malate/lactate dehydrogenase